MHNHLSFLTQFTDDRQQSHSESSPVVKFSFGVLAVEVFIEEWSW